MKEWEVILQIWRDLLRAPNQVRRAGLAVPWVRVGESVQRPTRDRDMGGRCLVERREQS